VLITIIQTVDLCYLKVPLDEVVEKLNHPSIHILKVLLSILQTKAPQDEIADTTIDNIKRKSILVKDW